METEERDFEREEEQVPQPAGPVPAGPHQPDEVVPDTEQEEDNDNSEE